MDNSLVHIPVTSFLKALCKVVIVDSVVFLAKFGWALYYTSIGIRDKLQHNRSTNPKDQDDPDPLLAFILGCAVLFGVILRYLANYLMYRDASFTLVTGERHTRHFFCTRCCATSRTWVTISILNTGLTIIVAAVLGKFSLGPGVIFLIWEVLSLLVIGFLKIFVYRYFISVENRILINNERTSGSVVSSSA